MRFLRWLFRTRVRPSERNRIRNLQAVRIDKREDQPGFYLYGDIEFNQRRAKELRDKAQGKDGGHSND